MVPTKRSRLLCACHPPRRPNRGLDDVDGGQYRVKRSGELGVAIAEEEPEAPPNVAEINEWLRASG